MAEFKSHAKIKYAVKIHSIETEQQIYEGILHLRDIAGFMKSLFARGMIMTQHYQLDPGCQPKIVQLGKAN